MSTSLDTIMEEEEARAQKMYEQNKLYKSKKRWHLPAQEQEQSAPAPRFRQSHDHYNHAQPLHEYDTPLHDIHPLEQHLQGATPTSPVETLLYCNVDGTLSSEPRPPHVVEEEPPEQEAGFNAVEEKQPLDPESLMKLSVDELQYILNKQRADNRGLMEKYQEDEHKFARVVRHHEKKNNALQESIESHPNNTESVFENAENMALLLKERQEIVACVEKEVYDIQLIKAAMHQEQIKSEHILSEIKHLKHRIAEIEPLIVQTTEELDQIRLERLQAQREKQEKEVKNRDDDDEKDGLEVNEPKIKNVERGKLGSIKKSHSFDSDDAKSEKSHSISPQKPKTKHELARELIEKNTYYQEAVSAMRKEVDTLRARRVIRV